MEQETLENEDQKTRTEKEQRKTHKPWQKEEKTDAALDLMYDSLRLSDIRNVHSHEHILLLEPCL